MKYKLWDPESSVPALYTQRLSTTAVLSPRHCRALHLDFVLSYLGQDVGFLNVLEPSKSHPLGSSYLLSRSSKRTIKYIQSPPASNEDLK